MAVAVALQKKVAMTGNEAVAQAMRQIEPDVVAAYPITPATDIVQYFSNFVANGQVKTEFVTTESEHSAMSACVGASAAGVRAMTATASNGLALMWEVLYIASGMRLPLVMTVVNRALSSPINIHCDHSDSMGARDAGWIQIYSENTQEAYDNVIQAIRIAQHPKVLLPVMVMLDGFIISHAMENLEILEDGDVKEFIGEYRPERYLLDADHPITIGALDLNDYYFEHKRQQVEGLLQARKVILEVAGDYQRVSGRSYGLFEAYRMEDAEAAIVVMSSTAGTVRTVVDAMRKEGHRIGLIKPRVFRPFPARDLAEVLRGVKAVAVMDRSESMSTAGGPLFTELRSAIYELEPRPLAADYIFGLGGRDIYPEDVCGIFQRLLAAKPGDICSDPMVTYLGVRE
ncbi:MAG: pyruvate ferredoxin oxidoreductase [Firmicutes bacterium]|nr:pyruvate ferredoxin oxidoreductase [Bacillota bacterium]